MGSNHPRIRPKVFYIRFTKKIDLCNVMNNRTLQLGSEYQHNHQILKERKKLLSFFMQKP